MGVLRKANIQNFRAALDDFADNARLFKNLVEQVNFLQQPQNSTYTPLTG